MHAFACSGVVSSAVTMSSFLKLIRASGGGFSGNGCVGEYHSPGASPAATGRSSTPKIVAGPVAAPVVTGGRSERHIHSAALFIQRQIPSPDIHAGTIFPTVIEPC